MKKGISSKATSARRILAALSFVSLFAAILPLAVQASASKRDIVQRLKDMELRPFLRKDRPLCQAFFEDFREQKNITYIEPIIRTDDYNDPRLKPYIGKCPDLELNKYMTFEASIIMSS